MVLSFEESLTCSHVSNLKSEFFNLKFRFPQSRRKKRKYYNLSLSELTRTDVTRLKSSNLRSTYKTSRKKHPMHLNSCKCGHFIVNKTINKTTSFCCQTKCPLNKQTLNRTGLSERLGKKLGPYFFQFNRKDMNVNFLWAIFARQQPLSFYLQSVPKMHDLAHELCTVLKNASKTEDRVFLHDTRYLFLFCHFIGKNGNKSILTPPRRRFWFPRKNTMVRNCFPLRKC